MKRWILAPVREPLNMVNVWEHTPLDYYRCGEYPRFIRPVDAHKPKMQWVLLEDGDATTEKARGAA